MTEIQMTTLHLLSKYYESTVCDPQEPNAAKYAAAIVELKAAGLVTKRNARLTKAGRAVLYR